MGNFFMRGFQKLFGGPEVRILMVGLDNAGKTTILYKLRLNETVSTVPTIGFNVETVQYKNIAFTVWDIGGQVCFLFIFKYFFLFQVWSDVYNIVRIVLHDEYFSFL